MKRPAAAKRSLETSIEGLSDKQAKKLLLEAALNSKDLQQKIQHASQDKVRDPDWHDFGKSLPEYIEMSVAKPAEVQAKMYEKIFEHVAILMGL